LATITLTGPDGVGLAVDLREADEGTVAEDLSELILALGTAAQAKGSGVVFLLDEVQFASEIEYRSLISALHRATQKNLPISAAAAGLPQIPRLTGEARSYAERLFSFPVIASLGERDARAALVEPARRARATTRRRSHSHSNGPGATRSTSSNSGSTRGTSPLPRRSPVRTCKRRYPWLRKRLT
jgi:hypothetical protein